MSNDRPNCLYSLHQCIKSVWSLNYFTDLKHFKESPQIKFVLLLPTIFVLLGYLVLVSLIVILFFHFAKLLFIDFTALILSAFCSLCLFVLLLLRLVCYLLIRCEIRFVFRYFPQQFYLMILDVFMVIKY